MSSIIKNLSNKILVFSAICLFLLCLSVVPTSVYAITYYVKFNPNGGSGTMSNQTFTTDEEKYLSTNTFTREGYNFIGWNSNTGGTGTWYMPSKKVKNLTSTSGATVDVYAQWMSKSQGPITIGGSEFLKDSSGNYIFDNYKKYTVSVVVNNGTVDVSSKQVEYYTSAVFNLTPTTGYGLPTVSCTNSQSGLITNNTLTVTGLSNNTTCTVTYVATSFTLTADSNGGNIPITNGWTGSGNTATKTVTLANEYGTLPIPTRSDYIFAGWFTEETSGTQIVSSTVVSDVTINTIYAHWLKSEEEYPTTDNYQTFTAPAAGKYKVELWGAQGGYDPSYAHYAKGGYTSGTIELEQGEKLYVYVGAQGDSNRTVKYNGGGYGGLLAGSYSGGGATDVRLTSGAWDNSASLASRIMVAGAGGGTAQGVYNTAGGGSFAGGLTGSTGGYYSGHGDLNAYGKGGSQTAGGAAGVNIYSGTGTVNPGGFGVGGNSDTTSSGAGAGGGGGGYYGGGAGGATQSGGSGNGAGGGSSYISGYQGSVAITSASNLSAKCTQAEAIGDINCSYHYSGKKFTNTNMIAGNATMPTYDNTSTMSGNSGDGHAKITLLELDSVDRYDLTYDFNTLNNMSLWEYVAQDKFTVTYDSYSKMNNISVAGTSGFWENVYMPIATTLNKDYKVTFDYMNISGYSALNDTYPGIGVQALTNVDNSNNVSNSVKTQYLLSPTANENTQHLTFEFTARSTTTYLAFNFGMAADGATTSVQLGNFKMIESAISGSNISDIPSLLEGNTNSGDYYTAASGGTKVTTSTTMPADDTTYYAQLDSGYSLTVIPNAGTINQSYTLSKFSGQSVVIPKFDRIGYTFTGWTKTGPGELTKYGKGLYNENNFYNTNNSMVVYNNSGNGTVTHTRMYDTTNPIVNSSYVIKIVTNGSATPGLGGFYQNTQSRANAVFYHVIVAKIPRGYTIEHAQNATGDGRTIEWLTPQDGTGKYETYIYKHTCGSSGTFSTFGHVYLQAKTTFPSTSVTWYVAYANMFDYTANPNAEDAQVFTFGSGNTTLSANWSQDIYTVSLSVVNGSVSGSSSLTTTYGESVTFSVTPNSTYGYHNATNGVHGCISCTSGIGNANDAGTSVTIDGVSANSTCALKLAKISGYSYTSTNGTGSESPNCCGSSFSFDSNTGYFTVSGTVAQTDKASVGKYCSYTDATSGSCTVTNGATPGYSDQYPNEVYYIKGCTNGYATYDSTTCASDAGSYLSFPKNYTLYSNPDSSQYCY